MDDTLKDKVRGALEFALEIFDRDENIFSQRLACQKMRNALSALDAEPVASSAQTLEQDETPCPECFQSGCNGECMGCGLMGG